MVDVLLTQHCQHLQGQWLVGTLQRAQTHTPMQGTNGRHTRCSRGRREGATGRESRERTTMAVMRSSMDAWPNVLVATWADTSGASTAMQVINVRSARTCQRYRTNPYKHHARHGP